MRLAIDPARAADYPANIQAILKRQAPCSAWLNQELLEIDTETGFKNAVLVNAAYGLGENVVQGSVNPDEYCVFKPTLNQGFRPILEKRLGTKEFKLIYDVGGGRMGSAPLTTHH